MICRKRKALKSIKGGDAGHRDEQFFEYITTMRRIRLMTDGVFRFIPLKSGVSENRAASGKSRIFLTADFSVMLFSPACAAGKYDFFTDRIGDDNVFHRMRLLSAAVKNYLFFRFLRTLYLSFGAVSDKGKSGAFFQGFFRSGRIPFRQILSLARSPFQNPGKAVNPCIPLLKTF